MKAREAKAVEPLLTDDADHLVSDGTYPRWRWWTTITQRRESGGWRIAAILNMLPEGER